MVGFAVVFAVTAEVGGAGVVSAEIGGGTFAVAIVVAVVGGGGSVAVVAAGLRVSAKKPTPPKSRSKSTAMTATMPPLFFLIRSVPPSGTVNAAGSEPICG